MPRLSPVTNTVCYGRIERAIKDWMDRVPLMEWRPYSELVLRVCWYSLNREATSNMRSAISRACQHLSTDIHYLERYPAKRTRLIRRLY